MSQDHLRNYSLRNDNTVWNASQIICFTDIWNCNHLLTICPQHLHFLELESRGVTDSTLMCYSVTFLFSGFCAACSVVLKKPPPSCLFLLLRAPDFKFSTAENGSAVMSFSGTNGPGGGGGEWPLFTVFCWLEGISDQWRANRSSPPVCVIDYVTTKV